jgi:hypothetical protein
MQVSEGWQHAPDLAAWLLDVRLSWGRGQLLAGQAAQLAALGLEPLAS